MAHTQHQTRPETDSAETSAGDSLPTALIGLGDRLPDWPWIAGFVVVTLVVFSIGSAISGGVEQLVRPPAPQRSPVVAAAPPTTAGDTATDVTGTTLTTDEPAVGDTGGDTDAIGPAVIEVSSDEVDFGAEAIAGEFELSNTGDQEAEWSAESSSEAIAFSARGGTLSPGETVTLRVSLDRSLVAEGEMSETITIKWGERELEIAATATHEDLPIIHNPQASPATVAIKGEGCSSNKTTISARIRDTSEIASVVARWSSDGSAATETTMSSVGNDMFEGVIGPFTSAQTATVRIVAFDEYGNAGGASVTVTVDDCQ